MSLRCLFKKSLYDAGMDNYEYLHKEFGVSRETYEKLTSYVDLLKTRNDQLNLIGKGTIDNIWERHIIDSIQLSKHLKPGSKILDFGSGAGLPGLILAILGFEVISVESIAKKCKFQQEIVDKLGLNCKIINDRIENFHVEHEIIVTARAVAALKKLFSLSQKHLTNGRTALFMKGRSYKEEISDAQKLWSFKYKAYKSITSDESVILKISELKWKS